MKINGSFRLARDRRPRHINPDMSMSYRYHWGTDSQTVDPKNDSLSHIANTRTNHGTIDRNDIHHCIDKCISDGLDSSGGCNHHHQQQYAAEYGDDSNNEL
jgi:hypothetical protein